MAHPLVSILIINWNGASYLADCLDSIQSRVTVPFEVVMLDNHSSDSSAEMVAEQYPWVKLIRSEDNLGFARGNNVAARAATGKYLLLLNNDTVLRTDLVDGITALEQNPHLGAVGAEMYGRNGQLRLSCAHFPTPARLWFFASLWYKFPAPHVSEPGLVLRRCDFVEGSFLMTRAADWARLGGMDERNYMYGDDLEYCRALMELNLITAQCPSMQYTHFGGYTHARMGYLFGGFRRYHRKYSSRSVQIQADLVLRTGLLLRLPWYWVRAMLRRDAASHEALVYALLLNRNWDETLVDAHRFDLHNQSPRAEGKRLTRLLEALVSRLKGRPFTIDRRIPLRVLLTIMIRRSVWLMRGIAKTTLLQGRPTMMFIAPRVTLRNASLCTFSAGVTLETGVLIDGLSTEGIHLGKNVMIGAYSQLRASTVSNLGSSLTFGDDSSCEAYSFIGAGGQITIGRNVIMGQHVSFHAENHVIAETAVPIRMQGVTRQGIIIEDDCWIGANAVFLDGCHLSHGCVVAAGAVVRGHIPPFSIIGGVPARIIRSRLAEAQPEAGAGA